jgi:hypothetical protein
MWGIIAVDLRRGYSHRVCTDYESASGFITYPTRDEATTQAAELTAWYQRDVRGNVVYSAVPLPLY